MNLHEFRALKTLERIRSREPSPVEDAVDVDTSFLFVHSAGITAISLSIWKKKRGITHARNAISET